MTGMSFGFGSLWGLRNAKLRLCRQNGKRSARLGSGRQWDTLIQSMGHQLTLVDCSNDWHRP